MMIPEFTDKLMSRLMGGRYDWKMITAVMLLIFLWPSAGLFLALYRIVTWNEYLYHTGAWCVMLGAGLLFWRILNV